MEFLAQFHPKVIHFAVSLLIIYSLFEILGAILKNDFLRKTAHLILFLGVLSALGAVITGNQAKDAFDYWNKNSSDMVEMHETYATITLWFFAALLLVRTFLVLKKRFSLTLNYLFACLSIVGMFFVFQTGERGGKLVFEFGVGTQIKKQIMEGTTEPEHKDSIKTENDNKQIESK